MATKFLAKNGFINLSKAFPQTQLSLKPSRKVSRVCFTSASKHSDGRNAAEESRDSRADKAYDSSRQCRRNDADSDPDEVTERAKEAMKENMERSKETAKEMKDRAKEYAHETKEKTKDTSASVSEKAREKTQRAAETTEGAKERAKDYAHGAKEKVKEGTHKAEETAKERTHKAAETVKSMGEKAKETVQSAWDTAKETGQKIKETVVGTPDEEVGRVAKAPPSGDEIEVEVEEAPPKDKVIMDEDVVERRKRARKPDQKS
ncbi:Desiccation-related protein [Parasponia andersonii]|uniref:Desiccation-related protein n=1 Tax=Parasponia andersonii TaxID=3476 RepID=A0A2P5AMT0_PARAD|nr:Desiccation-related protein [Parasponia andersonii]